MEKLKLQILNCHWSVFIDNLAAIECWKYDHRCRHINTETLFTSASHRQRYKKCEYQQKCTMQWSLQPDAAWEIFSVCVLKVQYFQLWLQTLQWLWFGSISHCQNWILHQTRLDRPELGRALLEPSLTGDLTAPRSGLIISTKYNYANNQLIQSAECIFTE